MSAKKLLFFLFLLCISLIIGISQLENKNSKDDKNSEIPNSDNGNDFLEGGQKQTYNYSKQLKNYVEELKEFQTNQTKENQSANYSKENEQNKQENEIKAFVNYVLSETNKDSEIILPNSQNNSSGNETNDTNRFYYSNNELNYDNFDFVDFDNNSVKTNSYNLIAVKNFEDKYEDLDNISIITDGKTYSDNGYTIANEISVIKFSLQSEITSSQNSNGSWNNNTEDTALAVYSLSYGENNTIDNENAIYELTTDNDNAKTIAIEKGIEYLQSKEEDYSWETNKESALSIIALNENNIEVKNELKTLSEKQNKNGSFGNIEETSWVVVSFAKTNSFKEQREKALNWLLTQKTKNEKEIALITFALSENEKSLKREKSEKEGVIANNFSLIYYFILIFAGILVSFALFSKINAILEGRRREIYEYIKKNPGEHLNKIMKEFNLSPSSAMHHLKVLENSSLVVSQKSAKYKRYFANGTIATTNGNKAVIGILKNETAKKIVEFLMNNKVSQSDLAEKLKVHPSTIGWHTSRLQEFGILKRERNGKEIYYAFNDENGLKNLLYIVNNKTY